MNQVTRRASFMIVLFAVMAAGLFAADVNGKWVGDVDTPGGQMSVTFSFKLDGDKVTGTLTGPQGDIEISDGKMDGDTLQFGFSVDAGGQQLAFKCTGKLAGDDQLKISMNGGGDMNFEVNAKRSTN